MKSIPRVRDKLAEKGLKITPQRIAILEAIYALGNHPTAEMILAYMKDAYPSIGPGTLYKVLDVLIENQLIKRVKTEKDIMRYDGIVENHHHVYCSESGEIKDYMDPDLDQLLATYFKKNEIENFDIEEIKLQIHGKFLKQGK